MITFGALKTAVSKDLRDPSAITFDSTAVGDMVQSALATLGRVAPRRFQEDITPVANVMSYQLQKVGSEPPIPEIEVRRVEIWDRTKTPYQLTWILHPASSGYIRSSAAGWECWGGMLSLTNGQERTVEPTRHVIRVWGYSPYLVPASDSADMGISNEIEKAVRELCRIEGLRRLIFDRDLFSQWQTRAGATDVTVAGLMNALSLAEASWRRTERQIAVLREPG